MNEVSNENNDLLHNGEATVESSFSNDIFLLEEEADIAEFLKCIEESDAVVGSGQRSNYWVDISDIINMMSFPITIVYEKCYVDKVYRDSYYMYFASKYLNYDRNCKRLSFFQGAFDNEQLYNYNYEGEKLLQDAFIGITVIRPLLPGKIGRTLLNPKKLNIEEAYVRTTDFNCIILGHNLTINAFPFSSQDAETMTCAEITVWEIMEYFGTRYAEYQTVLPNLINHKHEELSQERSLPTRGLDYYEVSELLKTFCFAPRLYARQSFGDDEFRRLFHYYVESGIPLAVGVTAGYMESGEKKEIRHSVVCVGHSGEQKNLTEESVAKHSLGEYKYIETADLYCKYILMDDNQCPYRIEPFENFTKYPQASVEVFAVPLYRRAFLEAQDASVIIKEILQHPNVGFEKFVAEINETVDDNNPLLVRIYMTSSRKYRMFRAKHETSIRSKNFYNAFQFPKFIWVAEITSAFSYHPHNNDSMVYGDIVIDATAGRLSGLDSLIMIRYLDHIGYRTSRESFEEINRRLKYRNLDFTYPYSMYDNNLKHC